MSSTSIAVIGSGISGLSAAWLLSKSHDVTLFEQDTRPGGHSNTLTVTEPEGSFPVDTGFIVYNVSAYPNLVALFDHLGGRPK
jgi:predicted NAD/FAD-binding protein